MNSSVQATYAAGSWHCYRMPDGLTRELVGCSHRIPRSAVQHATELTERATPRSGPEPFPLAGERQQARSGAPLVEDASGAPLGMAPVVVPPTTGVHSPADPSFGF